MRYILQTLAVLAIFSLLVSGCKKDDATTNPGGTTVTHASGAYTGILAGAATTGGAPVSGTMTLNIPTSKSVAGNEQTLVVYTVTGSYTIAGVTSTITGSYNTDNDSLIVTSTAGFSFRGTYNQTTGALQGTWTTPTSTGNFVAATGSGTTVSVYLGTWTSTAHAGTTGAFNMAVKGPAALGIISAATYRYPFQGTMTGDSVKISVTYSGLTVQIAKGAYTDATHAHFNGTYSLPAVSGHSDAGTWTADKAN